MPNRSTREACELSVLSHHEPAESAKLKARLKGLRGLAGELLIEMESIYDLLHTGGAGAAAPDLRLVKDFHLDFERPLDFYAEVRRFEIGLITRALLRAGGNQRRAADLLSLKPSTLSSKIKSYHLHPQEQKARPGSQAGEVFVTRDTGRGEEI